MPEKTLWNEDYKGPRWRYAFLFRPVNQGLPEGAIAASHCRHPKYIHGTVDWPRELTEREVHTYELELIEVLQGE